MAKLLRAAVSERAAHSSSVMRPSEKSPGSGGGVHRPPGRGRALLDDLEDLPAGVPPVGGLARGAAQQPVVLLLDAETADPVAGGDLRTEQGVVGRGAEGAA